MASSAVAAVEPQILVKDVNGVRTLTFNRPKRLNGWSPAMITAIEEGLEAAAADIAVTAVILTGSGRYYCAGVDFAGSLAPMHPKSLHEMIRVSNEKLFGLFLSFSKPLFVAANGSAIGASVTSAFLSDGIVACDSASFSTPFKSLGLVPEGCSSYTFPKAFGTELAQEILQGKVLSAAEALKVGYCQAVVPAEDVQAQTQAMAEEWVAAGRPRKIATVLDELKEVNKQESVALADAMLDYPFLNHMVSFTYAKGKYAPFIIFWLARFFRPLWSRM